MVVVSGDDQNRQCIYVWLYFPYRNADVLAIANTLSAAQNKLSKISLDGAVIGV